jgi:hypothetical protein
MGRRGTRSQLNVVVLSGGGGQPSPCGGWQVDNGKHTSIYVARQLLSHGNHTESFIYILHITNKVFLSSSS